MVSHVLIGKNKSFNYVNLCDQFMDCVLDMAVNIQHERFEAQFDERLERLGRFGASVMTVVDAVKDNAPYLSTLFKNAASNVVVEGVAKILPFPAVRSFVDEKQKQGFYKAAESIAKRMLKDVPAWRVSLCLPEEIIDQHGLDFAKVHKLPTLGRLIDTALNFDKVPKL